MAEQIVINTSPLIALSRIDVLEVIRKLPFEFVCPSAVREELDTGVLHGYPALVTSWIQVLPLSSVENPIARVTLDRGEAAVIQLALERKIKRVCIDDWKGRRVALAVGLEITGTLGLLTKAKLLGLIPAVRPCIEQLNRHGAWYDEKLIQRVLMGIGENW
jgi:hypothetical protein